MSLKDIQKLLDKIIDEQKKPRVKLIEDEENETTQLKEITKGIRQIVKIKSDEFNGFKEYLKKIPTLSFYIASGYNTTIFVFVVFKKIVELDYPNIKCYRGFPSYWDNITWLWKQGIYVDSYGFIAGEDLRKKSTTAEDVLELSDEEAKSTLTLMDYTLYLELKK